MQEYTTVKAKNPPKTIFPFIMAGETKEQHSKRGVICVNYKMLQRVLTSGDFSFFLQHARVFA